MSLKLKPRVRFEGLSPAGTVGRRGFWRLMRHTESRSLEPRSEQKVEIERSAKRRRRRSARGARVATGQHAESVGKWIGEKIAAEGLEGGESLEGLR